MAVAQVRVLGGAMRRVAVDATAFAHRDHGVMFSAAVKRAYDPTNLFHHNVNVPPSPDGA